MPKRREGPRRDKKTGFYYFDEYVGLGQDKKRIRFSLKTRDPDKARWRWEQEYRKHWSKYYGIESPAKPSKISFGDLANEFVEYERTVKKVKEWETVKNRLRIIHELWGEITLDKIDKDKLIELDEHLRSLPISEEKKGRSEATINHYFGLLKTFFNIYPEDPGILRNPGLHLPQPPAHGLDDHGLRGPGERGRPGRCDEDPGPQPGRDDDEVSPRRLWEDEGGHGGAGEEGEEKD